MHISLCCSTEIVIETKTRHCGQSKSEPQYPSQQKRQRKGFRYHHQDHIQDCGKNKKQSQSKSEFKVWPMRR